MRTFAKYLKTYILLYLVVAGALFLRSQLELKLPDYMSDIVNYGIPQNGIDSAVPEVIRETSFEMLTVFIPEGKLADVNNSYKLLDKNVISASDYEKYVKKYPLLAEENILILNTSDKKLTGSFEIDLGKAIVLSYMQNAGPGSAQTGMTVGEATDTRVIQIASQIIKAEYEAIGVDLQSYQTNYILRSGGMMLLMLVFILVIILTETFLSSRAAAGVARSLRRDVFKKVTLFSNSEFDKFSTASLITRSTNDIQQIQMMLFMFMRFVVYSPLLGVGAVFKVVNTGSGMTWIIGLSVFLTLILVICIFSTVMPKFKIIQKFVDRINLVTREALTGMMVIRAFNTEGYEEEKFDKANKDIKGLNLFVNRVFSFMNPFMIMLLNGTTLLILWVGAHAVDAGNLQLGTMMAFIQYAMQIINSFMMLTMIAMNLPRALVSINRISEVLTTESSIIDPKPEKVERFDSGKKGVVEFKNVCFRYPNAEVDVLHDISFTAKPGETTAFIGSTGSGKSTVINLLPRFYDATGGQILLDGIDVRNVKQKDLRRKIGYVPQKGLLFSGSIESNIKFGSEAGVSEITDEDMVRAADIAQAKNFIEEKPDKYFDPIAQAGANVSGGQKQRLSIARAIAKKPEVFIFDDSFSALDYKTDTMLRKALSQNLADATILVVGQRIGTIKNAEQIIVLDEGKIAGKGTHSELLKSCEVYKQIALSQLSEKELEEGMNQTSGREEA